jgi:hypothetical protein
MALISKASLLMVPSTYEPGTLYNVLPSGNRAPDSTDQNSGYDQTRADFDFDRGSNAAATRIGSDGLIKKYRENKLLRSNKFDTTWTKSSATIASGQSGYDGTSDAWLFTTSVAGASLEQSITAAGVVVFSLYAKANSVNGVRLRIDAATDANGYFNLSTGAVHSFAGSAIDASITAIGEGWYRCEVAANISSPVKVAIYTTDGTTSYDNGSIYIQSAQLETGLVATDVLTSGATTAKAGVLVDLPRINFDANGENGNLLLEPSRQNKIQYSEYFGGWGQINTINTANALTSPEGLQNANKLIAASGVNNNVINQQISAGTYTASVFAKKGEFEGLFIGSGPTGAFFNLNTYAYRTHYQSAPTSYKIEDYGNGWHRYSITFTISGNDSLYIGPNDNVSNTLGVTGNNSNGIYIYGAQIEEATYPSSYIPNHGESGGVTRAADSCSVTGASDVIGQTEGTLYAEVDWNVKPESGSPVIGILTLNNGANNLQNSILLGIERQSGGTNRVYCFVINSNVTQAELFGSAITDGVYKIAVSYKENDFALYVNGSQIATDTSGSVPALSEVLLGKRFGTDTYNTSDGIKQATLFKERLSNAELATLTTL